ncbi:MAG: hypothetical protein JNK82_07780 [Myxococcaceae bacterium]|nr:hypothetical protein [Myxococcaceae bacterium]
MLAGALRCSNCHAPIGDDVEECEHCHTVTESGRELRRQRAEAAAAQEAAAKQRAERDAFTTRIRQIGEVTSAANRSLMVSLLGLLACCLPVGPIIGVVLARGAQKQAETLNVPGGRGTAALVVSLVALSFSLFGYGMVGWVAKAEADRKNALHAIIAKEASAETLSSAGACALLELELINAKYEEYSAFNDELTCPGEVVPHGAGEAKLLGSHFSREKRRVDVVACFHKSATWSVKQLRADADCDAPPPPPPDKPAHKKPPR